jgi:hypothetical protein
MKGWKLGAAALAICTGLSGGAWAQTASTERAQSNAVVQTSWQDHDRDDNGKWRNDGRDQDRDHDRDNRNRDNRDRVYRQDRDRNGAWRNNGWYGQRGDGDRDDANRNSTYRAYPGQVYGNGPYRAYPGGTYGYGQPVYGRGGNGRYGNNAAAQMGYQDGLSYGQNDAARGKGYNATGSEAYEQADRGYNSSFGDRNSYRQEYRHAYQQGYSAGYNGGYGRH